VRGSQAYLGCGPENMRWDLSLNKDGQKEKKRHIFLTHELAKDDPKMFFDLSTPKRGAWAY
jgi:hypothetical protein